MDTRNMLGRWPRPHANICKYNLHFSSWFFLSFPLATSLDLQSHPNNGHYWRVSAPVANSCCPLSAWGACAGASPGKDSSSSSSGGGSRPGFWRMKWQTVNSSCSLYIMVTMFKRRWNMNIARYNNTPVGHAWGRGKTKHPNPDTWNHRISIY